MSLPARLRRLVPDGPFFADAAAGGERLVARMRLALLLFVGLTVAMPGADPLQRRVGLALTLVGFAVALAMYFAVTRRFAPWMGLASSALDVSFVSAALLTFVCVGQPHTAVNSKVVFEVYFLIMICASLRYDWRSTAAAGALAVTQYACIALYVGLRYDLNSEAYAPYSMGKFSWAIQASRLMLLLGAAVASTGAVLRAQHLRQLSATDRLTGLWNRGTFDERLAEEASRARRHERPFSLAMLDLDRFKQWNDTHGHAAGDAALRAVADVLRRSVRREDVVARYGGEEFVVLFPETPAGAARERLEHIRVQIAASIPLVTRTGPGPSVTASVGVAAWPRDGADVESVLVKADQRLYAAKQAGRNRVIGGETA